MTNVLFVCIQNAGRSQISQALFDRAAAGRHAARSAGSRPAARVHPEVAEVLAEQGIDVSANLPHRLDAADMAWADVVVTMGCGDECPYLPARQRLDWDLPDPKNMGDTEFRTVRDRIEQLVRDLLENAGAA